MAIELGLLGSIAVSLGSSIVSNFLFDFFKDKEAGYKLSHTDLKHLQEGVLNEIRNGDESNAPMFSQFYSILVSMNSYLENIKEDTAYIRKKVDCIDQKISGVSVNKRGAIQKPLYEYHCSAKEDADGSGGFNMVWDEGFKFQRAHLPDCKYCIRVPPSFFSSAKYFCKLKEANCPHIIIE